MPRPRFEKLPLKKKEQILEAAAKEFAEHGFDDASLNHLLKEAGISKGAAYYYFDDKVDLFLTVVAYYWEHVIGEAEFEIERLTADNFWPEWGKFFLAILDHANEHAWVLGVAKLIWRLSVEARAQVQLADAYSLIREWFGAVLQRGRELGTVRDDLPDDYLLTLVVALDQASDQWLVAHWDAFNQKEKKAHILKEVDIFRRMLSPV